MPDIAVLFTAVPVVVVVLVLLLIIFLTGYVKASPDTAIIISGLRKNPKVLIGKAGVKIPFLERKDELNLQLIPIDVKTSNAVPTADYININVDATVNVKISDKADTLRLAAQNFLNKKPEYIARVAVNNVKNVRNAKAVIEKAFRNQVEGKGFSLVEVISSCPTNWGMTPDKALEWVEEKMIPYYPLGVYRDKSAEKEAE